MFSPQRSAIRRSFCAVLLGLCLSIVAASPALAGGGVAYAPPGFVWGAASNSNYGVFGHPGYHQPYTWRVAEGSSTNVCVEVYGFSATYPRGHWYGGGCGESGFASAPWGNVLAVPKLRAKSYSIFTGGFVEWYH
jgi:hypothetical protein